MIYSVIGVVCVVLIGFIAHRVGICLVRGVSQALNRQPGLLLAILMSGLWVSAYSVAANYYQWTLPQRFDFNLLFALGGFIFGIGASVNQGCSVSTMHQFARGNISMLFTMVGWLVGWYLWRGVGMSDLSLPSYQQLEPLSFFAVVSTFGLAVIMTLAVLIAFPRQRQRWLGISFIGLLVGVLFYIEPQWAPSRLIQDSGAALFDGASIPTTYRYALLMLLLAGMWLSVILLRNFKLRWPTFPKLLRHTSAGIIMGFGSAMALGGNDTQILLGLPVLSLAAITTIFFMLLGIATEQILYHQFAARKHKFRYRNS